MIHRPVLNLDAYLSESKTLSDVQFVRSVKASDWEIYSLGSAWLWIKIDCELGFVSKVNLSSINALTPLACCRE